MVVFNSEGGVHTTTRTKVRISNLVVEYSAPPWSQLDSYLYPDTLILPYRSICASDIHLLHNEIMAPVHILFLPMYSDTETGCTDCIADAFQLVLSTLWILLT